MSNIFDLISEQKSSQASKAVNTSLLQKLAESIKDKKIALAGEVYGPSEYDPNELIDEATPKRKVVVRNGKRKKIKKCKSGFKLQGGRCVKIKAKEKRRRSKGAKRGARKRKSKSASTERKRKKSMKKRR